MIVRICKTCGAEFTPPAGALKRKTGRYYGHCKLCVRKKDKVRLQKFRLRALAYLGTDPPKCKRCGFSDWRALQVDHIHGGGKKEYASARTNQIASRILKMPQDEARAKYQVLCANCNWIKRYENNEHN